MQPADYLKMPYGRTVFPETDGTYRAEIIEFPGCIATGDTAADALSNLEKVAESWLDIVLEKNQRVPEPLNVGQCSGKLMLRLPKTLHTKAAHLAAREGTSLNQLIAVCLAEKVGSANAVRVVSGWAGHLSVPTSIWTLDLQHTMVGIVGTAGGQQHLPAAWHPMESANA